MLLTFELFTTSSTNSEINLLICQQEALRLSEVCRAANRAKRAGIERRISLFRRLARQTSSLNASTIQ
jgi:hypothetical protein